MSLEGKVHILSCIEKMLTYADHALMAIWFESVSQTDYSLRAYLAIAH